MDFIISRTSLWDSETEQPCPEAKMVQATRLDWRTCESFEKVKTKHWGKDWFASGNNHREEMGMVVRDLERQNVWLIQINNLDELLNLQQRYNSLIIRLCAYKEYPIEIELYDDSRE